MALVEDSAPTATTLTCWLYGQDVRTVFDISTTTHTTILSFREACKKDHPLLFKTVDTCFLRLYKSDIITDHTLPSTLKGICLLDTMDDTKEMTAWTSIRDHFSVSAPPAQHTVHVIFVDTAQLPGAAGELLCI
jgi:hypothetical protein